MNRAKEGLRQLVSLGRLRPVLLTGAVGLVVLLVATRLRHDSQSLYLTAAVQRGEIRDAVDATGTVNAVTTVQVGSQVSGRIAKLNADFNSRVHRGDVIALGFLAGAMAFDDDRSTISQSQRNQDGFLIHTVESPYLSGKTEIRVLILDNRDIR